MNYKTFYTKMFSLNYQNSVQKLEKSYFKLISQKGLKIYYTVVMNFK